MKEYFKCRRITGKRFLFIHTGGTRIFSTGWKLSGEQTMLENLRNRAFRTLDFVRGSPISQAVRLIELLDNMPASSDFISDYHAARLSALVSHAVLTTKFYRKYREKKFENFPTISKMDIKESFDEFMSSQFKIDQLCSMSTSGSTGTPFQIFQDAEKKRRVHAECIYYSQKLGYDVGKKLVYIRSPSRRLTKSKFVSFIQNQPLINANDLSDNGISKILHSLYNSRKTPKTLLGYASTFSSFCEYFRKFGIDLAQKCNVTGIISGSDYLYDNVRDSISSAFGCNCASRYSNEENGILGQDGAFNNIFPLNEANYYIEIFKEESDEPAAEGTVGRIIVTDLYNFAMPLIRYDTGDLGAIEIVNIRGIPRRSITKFSGRSCDKIFNTSGERISPHAVTNVFWNFSQIKQFQFIQKSHSVYQIKINANSFSKAQEQLLTDDLIKFLGSDAQLDFLYINEIPVLASGKRKYIVSELQGK